MLVQVPEQAPGLAYPYTREGRRAARRIFGLNMGAVPRLSGGDVKVRSREGTLRRVYYIYESDKQRRQGGNTRGGTCYLHQTVALAAMAFILPI